MGFREIKDLYKVWVFVPYLETDDPNLQYYCDYTQSQMEYSKVFAELDCEWEWVNITMDNIQQEIEVVKSSTAKKNIILNLCDGDENNCVPGISVIDSLEENKMVYTGSDHYFYEITTSKITMKEAFDRHGIATPNWINAEDINEELELKTIGETVIVKPAVSAGSLGVSTKNVVSSFSDFTDVMVEMNKGYRGWNLNKEGIIVEEFISGREFTTFLVGSSTLPDQILHYKPVERVFHSSLPEKEQFLSFDRLWEIYEEESPLPDNGFLYEYAEVLSPDLIKELQTLSLDAFQAVNGMGYARLDIRMAKETSKLYVLEVNAQCGISEDENYTSIGAILRFSAKSYTDLIVEILEDALSRHKS